MVPSFTEGEKLVGLDFNPSQDENVNNIKRKAADLIDAILEMNVETGAIAPRFVTQAVDGAVVVQMLAVKAATWKNR